jgi:hypothetical protein
MPMASRRGRCWLAPASLGSMHMPGHGPAMPSVSRSAPDTRWGHSGRPHNRPSLARASTPDAAAGHLSSTAPRESRPADMRGASAATAPPSTLFTAAATCCCSRLRSCSAVRPGSTPRAPAGASAAAAPAAGAAAENSDSRGGTCWRLPSSLSQLKGDAASTGCTLNPLGCTASAACRAVRPAAGVRAPMPSDCGGRHASACPGTELHADCGQSGCYQLPDSCVQGCIGITVVGLPRAAQQGSDRGEQHAVRCGAQGKDAAAQQLQGRYLGSYHCPAACQALIGQGSVSQHATSMQQYAKWRPHRCPRAAPLPQGSCSRQLLTAGRITHCDGDTACMQRVAGVRQWQPRARRAAHSTAATEPGPPCRR